MYRHILAGWVCVAWGLWFGGLGALFLFVGRLFAVDHDLAVKTAPQLFMVFERYQILLAAAALLGTVAWRVAGGSWRATVVFGLLAVAAACAALGPQLVGHRMLELWAAGRSSTPEFRRLHGESMMVYSGETLILLVAGLCLAWAMGEEVKK